MALALASPWRRAVITAAGLLALGACGAVTAPATPPQPTALVIERSPRVASEIARGRQALAAGDLQAAQSAFTSALRGSPNDPEPALGLAETYLALGDLETAGRLFGVVASTEGGAGDARLLQGRGLVALGQGRTDAAIGFLEQSVERDPDHWRAWAGLGRAYARQGKSRQARTAFDRAEAVAPSPAVVINDLGMLNLEENDPAAALEAFQRALAVDPGNATASANARISRAMLGDYEAAVSGARPEELPDVLNNVGYIAVTNGDFDVADRLLRRAVAISPIYHEAATANLDLLAQAMKGVPVLALAEPRAAVSHSAAGAESSPVAVTGHDVTGVQAPPGKLDAIATDGWRSGHPGGAARTGSEQPLAGAAMMSEADLAFGPPQNPTAKQADGVMAHGFRWGAEPVSTAEPDASPGSQGGALPTVQETGEPGRPE